jgi:MFS family permease
MTPVAAPTLRPSRPRRLIEVDTPTKLSPAEQPRKAGQPSAYDRPFWLAYVSNLLLASAAALLFRYADFVTLLGGSEFHLGWIVGVGMIGSFSIRLAAGSWIDHYGARPLWLCSGLLFVVTCFAHLAVASHTGVSIYLLRIAYCCALAGIGGASMTFVSMRTANGRLAEMVGMLGTGGFLGTVFGTLLGDFLFGSITISAAQVTEMFVAAGLLGLLSMPFAWAASRNEIRLRIFPARPLGEGLMMRAGQGPGFRDQGSETSNLQISRSPNQHNPHPDPLPRGEGTTADEPSPLALVRRYCPRIILLIGVTMGMGLGLPSTFLRTYATELGIPRIGLFFLVYALAAIAIRVPTRRWTERFGPRRIILAGMAGMTASIAIFPLVHTEWQLILPAIGYGCSHAILWPAVVAAVSVAFPPRNRGLATILLLAAWDLGLLVASPAAGVILRSSKAFNLPPYPTMFLSITGLLGAVGLWYALASRNTESA